jgi:ankyrin repeat protein
VRERGLRAGAPNATGRTPLHVALRFSKGDVELVELLVRAAGCDVNAQLSTGATALYLAVEAADASVVQR